MARSVYLCPSSRSLAVRNRALVLGTVADDPSCLCTPAPTGACCLTSGLCNVLTQANCTGQGGVYRGDGTTCGGVTCDGACCNGSTCTTQNWFSCAQGGGAFQGFGASCSPQPCPQFGACCNSGVCTQTLAANCAGLWLQGQPCSPNPCPPVCCQQAGTCCYRPTINVPVIATLTTTFVLNYKQCCVNVFRSCPTYNSGPIQAQQTFAGSPNQCVSIPNLSLTCLASGSMACPGNNCTDPWTGWSASLAVTGLTCPGNVPTIQRRLRANTDPVATTNVGINCNSWTDGGTHTQSQFEFCGGGQTLQTFNYNASLSLSNLVPCNPAAFRMADFRTTAGGVLIPDRRFIPNAGMKIDLSGGTSRIVTTGGCAGCGGGILTGGALI